MEKLIELLNEYEKKTVVHWYEWYGQDVLMCRYIKDNFEFYTDEATTISISKYYGFIKWLVDNDKIKKNYKEGLPAITKNGFLLEGDTVLLMLLAISDTPIQDLCAWLK